MPAEEVQELGREGVAILKRWLEATTYIELPYDAYNHAIDCKFSTAGGQIKQFDLTGHMLIDSKAPVIVECKRYTTTGGQYKEFKKFLSIAYGHTLHEINQYGKTRKPEFYWVTYHPFNLDNWTRLEQLDLLQEAVAEYPEYSDDKPFDAALGYEVASRITVLVFNAKQEKLSLTREELQAVRPHLTRKVKEL